MRRSSPLRPELCLPLILAAGACASIPEEEEDGRPTVDELAPPERGFQLRTSGAIVAAGAEAELCDILELPGDPGDLFYVNKIEAAMSAGSHHLIVSVAEVDSESEQNVEVGARIPCTFG